MRRALIIMAVTALFIGAATTALALTSDEGASEPAAALQTQEDTTEDNTPTEEETAKPRHVYLENFLDRLVEDGKISREAADAILESIEDGTFREGFERSRGFGGPRGMGFGGVDLAELLGMEPEELRDAIAEGKTPQELAEERGIDLVAAHVAAAEERIATAEAEGLITSEQAAELRQRIQERAETMAEGEHLGLGGLRDHARGFRGFGGRGFGAPEDGANAEGVSISA